MNTVEKLLGIACTVKSLHVHRNQHCRTLVQHAVPGFYKNQKILACVKKFLHHGIPHCIILRFTAQQLASEAFSEIKVQKQSFADVIQNKCSQKQTPTQVFYCKNCEMLNMLNTFFFHRKLSVVACYVNVRISSFLIL